MRVKGKYKIARRLGAPVFDKTQTQKFDQSLQRKGRHSGSRRRQMPSEYALQLREKQKARYSYLIRERQFRNYVRKAMETSTPSEELYRLLETRLDSVIYRMGLAPTKSAARQISSHGHILINGKRSTIPSQQLKTGDKIEVKEKSKGSKMFEDIQDRLQHYTAPSWLSFNETSLSGSVEGEPRLNDADLLFDMQAILEFYSR